MFQWFLKPYKLTKVKMISIKKKQIIKCFGGHLRICAARRHMCDRCYVYFDLIYILVPQCLGYFSILSLRFKYYNKNVWSQCIQIKFDVLISIVIKNFAKPKSSWSRYSILHLGALINILFRLSLFCKEMYISNT